MNNIIKYYLRYINFIIFIVLSSYDYIFNNILDNFINVNIIYFIF